MVNFKSNSIKNQGLAQGEGIVPSLEWTKTLFLAGCLGLTGSGLAAAEVPEAVLAEPEGSVSSSEVHLEPTTVSRHLTNPSARPELTPSPTSVAQPDFSRLAPSPSIVQTSTPHVTHPMQPPVPPPTAAAIVIPAPAAAPTMAESLLKPATTPLANAATPAEASAGTAVSSPDGGGEANSLAVPNQIAADEAVPTGYNSVFIDPTTYGVGATQAPAVTPNMVFSERTTGCQITVAQGQTSSSCGEATVNGTAASSGAAAIASTGTGGIQVGPVNIGPRGVSLGSTTVISREALNERIRPLNVLRRGNEDYVFPLSIPASISSLFGWRMHPIHQSWRFHSGTDLAAPMGTPVLATQAGRVAVSDFLGGYGLTVILRHGEGTLESRYAHLSQITVRPGEWVEQGEVIGLVGSTGTSTGPHLHFEIRQLTGEGWVAMDPIEILEYGIANLLEIIDNPMLALNRTSDAKAVDAAQPELPGDYPFRPAQPNAS
jgi:murein DD-endopeptidase MepM/ murein hydrolase activator NlpD